VRPEIGNGLAHGPRPSRHVATRVGCELAWGSRAARAQMSASTSHGCESQAMHAVRGRQPEMRRHIGRIGGALCRRMRVRGSVVKHGAQELGGRGLRPA
jgi:hypothetical protein